MKKIVTRNPMVRSIIFFFLMVIATMHTFLANAQGETKKIDVDINTGGGTSFFATPWVWVVGGAVFILLLVALLRGGGRKEA